MVGGTAQKAGVSKPGAANPEDLEMGEAGEAVQGQQEGGQEQTGAPVEEDVDLQVKAVPVGVYGSMAPPVTGAGGAAADEAAMGALERLKRRKLAGAQ